MTEQVPLSQEEREDRELEEAEVEYREAQEALQPKQYKDMTQEEQTERNKDILVGIGFEYREEKGQFVYKEDTLTIGKTFNDKFPVGSQFWGFIGNKGLENGDLKKQEKVKQFYAIREGKEEIPVTEEQQGLQEQKLAIIEEVTPDTIVLDAKAKANTLYHVVEAQHLYVLIKGKKYLTVEAWELLGKFCNLTATIERVQPVSLMDSVGFEARSVIMDSEGRVISTAQSMCMDDEPTWQGKPMFQLASMAQTRAMSKAYRMCLSFIVSLAGYATSPAEEM